MRSGLNVTMINCDYTKTILRNNIKQYNTKSRLGGYCEDELNNVFELLIEIENEALAKTDKDYLSNDVAYKLLMRLEIIEEDVAANLRITTEAKYMVFLQEIYRTVNPLINKEVECSEKSYFLAGTMDLEQKIK